tara:strand:+ start:156 stop:413 length:258 start_codon:yes stop_codon:yes gene_type:complete
VAGRALVEGAGRSRRKVCQYVRREPEERRKLSIPFKQETYSAFREGQAKAKKKQSTEERIISRSRYNRNIKWKFYFILPLYILVK